MKNKVLIGVIVVLIGVIAFEGVYIFTHWDKKAEPEESYTNIPKEDDEELVGDEDSNLNDNTNEDVEDYVRLVDTREEGNQIIQNYEMVLNGEHQEFEIEFDCELGRGINGDFDTYYVTAEFDNALLYDMESYDQSNVFNISDINKNFNADNFRIITGGDNKSYLTVYGNTSYGIMLYIFNDDLELLTDDLISFDIFSFNGFPITLEYSVPCQLESGVQPWYENEWNVSTNHFINVKIEDNKIYFLAPTMKSSIAESEFGTVEERVYTISDSNLKYEVLNVYSVIGVCNGI